jgi:triphosphoribosyl-dephospho-CoA synthase
MPERSPRAGWSGGGTEALTVGQCASLAVILEATTPKPGNVHRGADFEDVSYADFLVGAIAIGPAMDRAAASTLGKTVLDAVVATRACVGTNTNLGTILLIAPLAMIPREQGLSSRIGDILARPSGNDARQVYEAIRRAVPGGMGRVPENDITGDAPPDLVEAMRAAENRDLVARQYARKFEDVFSQFVPWFVDLLKEHDLLSAIIRLHLRIMAAFPDSLIARKCGLPMAARAAEMAADVLAATDPDDFHARLAELDFWLRSDGNRRNPGTTADLVACSLFIALRDGLIDGPIRLWPPRGASSTNTGFGSKDQRHE